MRLQKMTKKKKIILISVCVLACIFAVFFLTQYRLELSLTEETTILEYGVDSVPEITAVCKGTLFNKEGTPIDYEVKGDFDLNKVGTYDVTFQAKYKYLTLSEKRTFIVQDTVAPTIELVTIPGHCTAPGSEYEEEGFTAMDNYDGDISDKVTSEIKDDTVVYTVTDSSGNVATAVRPIIYKDIIPPVITLTSGQNTVWNVGTDYVDPGYQATDNVDGDLTTNVGVRGTVNGHVAGSYLLAYDVEDSSGNLTVIERHVLVKDSQTPSILLNGDRVMYLELGSTYEEAGSTAYDSQGADLTANVTTSGSVDTSKMGLYTLVYSVTDHAGYTSSVKRWIYVYQKQDPSAVQNPTDKVVYLTFDDGPTRFTTGVLDTLDKYGVKATFFVTNQYSAYQNMISETAKRGHTIALHTYSHNFANVYSSLDAYYADFQDVVVAQTGKEANIVRFPGGTSNTVSRRYCRGIMTQITQQLPELGYLYCDWNVDSNDAGSARTSNVVAYNVMQGLKNYNTSIVLQHDTTSYSLRAIDEIIAWGLINGYTFLPMDSSTPMYHHGLNN